MIAGISTAVAAHQLQIADSIQVLQIDDRRQHRHEEARSPSGCPGSRESCDRKLCRALAGTISRHVGDRRRPVVVAQVDEIGRAGEFHDQEQCRPSPARPAPARRPTATSRPDRPRPCRPRPARWRGTRCPARAPRWPRRRAPARRWRRVKRRNREDRNASESIGYS